MNFIPVVWEKEILESAEQRIEGAIDYATRIGDPLGEVPAMKLLVEDIRSQLNNQK